MYNKYTTPSIFTFETQLFKQIICMVLDTGTFKTYWIFWYIKQSLSQGKMGAQSLFKFQYLKFYTLIHK